jgi:hypothetical protein
MASLGVQAVRFNAEVRDTRLLGEQAMLVDVWTGLQSLQRSTCISRASDWFVGSFESCLAAGMPVRARESAQIALHTTR